MVPMLCIQKHQVHAYGLFPTFLLTAQKDDLERYPYSIGLHNEMADSTLEQWCFLMFINYNKSL